MNTAVDCQDRIDVHISVDSKLVIQQEVRQSGEEISISINWDQIDQFIFACQQAKKDASR
jgi:hypothetical protein